MTPEHKVLVDELREHANCPIDDDLKYIQRADALMQQAAAAIESLSAQSAQPQAGEAVAFRAGFRAGEATGKFGDDTESDAWSRYSASLASPQPANPAQVTDAMVEAAAKELLAHGEFSSIPGNNEPNARIAARAALTAAIGAEPEEDAESQWRDLALQFDGHRIQAMCLLRAIAADKAGKAEIEAFLSAPPLSGEQVLTDRHEAPERIWAWPYKGEPNNGNWMVARFEKGTEYVRADRIEALERQLAEARAEPDGYVLVPKEPTEAMIEAHFAAHANAKTVFAEVPEIWRAMLSAAPQPKGE